MNYKASCPQCGTRLSRWHYFTTAFRYRCRSCGAQFRLTTFGWLVTIAMIVLLISFYVLYRLDIVSWQAAIALILLAWAVATWLIPYLTPVRFDDRTGQST